MDGYLEELSDTLAPPQEFVVHADRVMNNVSMALKRDSNYSIDRIRPVGGAEKKTSLAYSMDNDVTAFVNNVESPFRHTVVEDFQDVILRNFDIQEEDMKLTKYSVQFELDGVEFDLLVATNMASGRSQEGPVWKLQHAAMLRKIASSPNQRQASKHNSAALTETAVEFVKQQTTFVHKVARLAKFWNSTIFFTESLSGRSSIFELLGIDAGCEEERQNYKPSILRAFRIFLTRVENIHNQRIVFDKFYSKSNIPGDVLSQTPLILDPSNPYNNFMHRFEPSAQRLFSGYARESLARLMRVETHVLWNHGYPHFRILFLPQPKPIDVGPKIAFRMPTDWHVGTKTRPRYLQPNLIIRNKAVDKDKFVLKYVKKIMSSFMFIADLEVSHMEGNGKGRGQLGMQRVQEVIDDLFHGSRRAWGPTSKSHDQFDVTFEIPVGREGGDAVVVSFMAG